jgi:menaquinone-dependent protoporphyrinogen oxidase
MPARILIVYGSTDGQTAKIAQRIESGIAASGVEVTTESVAHLRPGLQLAAFDAVVVAAPMRFGKFNERVVDFVQKNARALAKLPNAFVAVSISAARDNPKAKHEVGASIDRFAAATGWKPERAFPVAGALLYTRYTLTTRFLMWLVSKMVGGDTDTSRDFEYTDWNAVDRFAAEFASPLAPRTTPGREAPAEARI